MNKSEMFEYIGKGNTLYDKIEEHFKMLDGDFSTASLLNHFKEQYLSDSMTDKAYKEIFNLISSNLINTIKRSEEGNSNEITPQQEYDLLLELKSFDGDSYRKDSFKSIEEYVDYAKYRIDDKDTKKIQEIIISFGIDFLPQKDKDSIRNLLLDTAYMPKINNFLKSKYSSEQSTSDKSKVSQDILRKRAFEKDPELEELEKAYIILKNPKLRKIYDMYLKDYMKKQAEVDSRLMLFHKCASKREIVVTDEIKSTMGNREKNSAVLNKNLLYPILGAPGSKRQQRGTYEWEFKEYEQPQVVLNSEAIYSENGIENQKVIVATHGQIRFSKNGKNTVTEELLGVTRIGEDRERTFFVAVPIGTMQQITTKEQEEFYSKIFTSDYYLEQVERDYNRFAGTVIQKQGKPKIVKETLNLIASDERDALNYAQNYNGEYRSKATTLEDMCHPHSRIPQKHKAVVEFIKGTKATKEQINLTTELKKPIITDFSEGPEGEDR